MRVINLNIRFMDIWKPELKLADFNLKQREGETYITYSYMDYEIVIKPCIAGFDVVIHKLMDPRPLETHMCTKIDAIRPSEAIKKVIYFANLLYKKYR